MTIITLKLLSSLLIIALSYTLVLSTLSFTHFSPLYPRRPPFLHLHSFLLFPCCFHVPPPHPFPAVSYVSDFSSFPLSSLSIFSSVPFLISPQWRPHFSPLFSLFSFSFYMSFDLLSIPLFFHPPSWHLLFPSPGLPLSLSPQWQTIWPQPGIFNGFITGRRMLLKQEQWFAEKTGRSLTSRVWAVLLSETTSTLGYRLDAQCNSQCRFI